MPRTFHPNSLQAWINENYLDEEGEKKKSNLVFADAGLDQAIWVRDTLGSLACTDVDYRLYDDGGHVKVVSTHRSKSVQLPVYSLEPPGKGVRFILRNNFYNWKVSVISDRELDVDGLGLFHAEPPVAPNYAGNDLHPVYFEGFPADLIFGYYSVSDKKKFSAQLGDRESVWAFMFLCLRAYEGVAWQEAKEKKDAELREKEAAYLKEKADSNIARLEAELAKARKEAGMEA